MRGYEPEDLVKASKGKITMEDLAPYCYPSDDAIEKAGVKGIYVSNFFYWDAKAHGREMIEKWGFGALTHERERSFNLYSKVEDHANEVHDYLKYLKFGYGRATDDASMEIRHGRMTREEGIALVRRYDNVKPESLAAYLEFLEISEKEFHDMIAPMRDTDIWVEKNGRWETRDSVVNHMPNESIEVARIGQVADRTFSSQNRDLYYNPDNPPKPSGDLAFDTPSTGFRIL